MIRVWGLMVTARNPLKVVVKRIALVDMPLFEVPLVSVERTDEAEEKKGSEGISCCHTRVTHDGRVMAEETERRT